MKMVKWDFYGIKESIFEHIKIKNDYKIVVEKDRADYSPAHCR